MKFGFATTCVKVAATPSASVDVLITVIKAGVVTIAVPLAAVDVKATGAAKVLSGCVVIVLVVGTLGACTTTTEVVVPVVVGDTGV